MLDSLWLKRLRLLPIYSVFLYTWIITGFSKLFGPGVAPSFQEKFGETFLAAVPGLTIAFYQIAIFEVIAGVLFLVSLFRLEFLLERPKAFLGWGLWMSMVNFAMLGFGLRLIGEHDGAANLFFYFGATAAITVYVEVFSQEKGVFYAGDSKIK